jgi:hypothetical protein
MYFYEMSNSHITQFSFYVLKKVNWDRRLKSQTWLGTFKPSSPPFFPFARNTATPGSMNKRDVVMNTDFPALCSQILETIV